MYYTINSKNISNEISKSTDTFPDNYLMCLMCLMYDVIDKTNIIFVIIMIADD